MKNHTSARNFHKMLKNSDDSSALLETLRNFTHLDSVTVSRNRRAPRKLGETYAGPWTWWKGS